jgi:hypothetical protein
MRRKQIIISNGLFKKSNDKFKLFFLKNAMGQTKA